MPGRRSSSAGGDESSAGVTCWWAEVGVSRPAAEATDAAGVSTTAGAPAVGVASSFSRLLALESRRPGFLSDENALVAVLFLF